MIKQYKKKPVIIEALQFTGDNIEECKQFCKDLFWNLEIDCWCIHTLEGGMKLLDFDYIIKGVKGEFYSCRKDIFEETYEEQTTIV